MTKAKPLTAEEVEQRAAELANVLGGEWPRDALRVNVRYWLNERTERKYEEDDRILDGIAIGYLADIRLLQAARNI